MFFDKMVSILINIIQLEQDFNNTINRPKGCNLIKKETLAKMFSSEFCKTSRNNFFIKHIQATAFGLSFVNR